MAKRSIDFKNNLKNVRDSKSFRSLRNIRENVPFHRDMLDREAIRRGVTERRDALRRTFEDKREALRRNPHTGPGHSIALARKHKIAVAGVATLGAAALAVSLAPGDSGPQSTAHSSPAAYSVSTGQQAKKDLHAGLTSQGAATDQKAQAAAAAKANADKAAAAAQAPAKAPAKAPSKAPSKAPAAKKDTSSTAGTSSAPTEQAMQSAYPNNLDGWIRESLAIMQAHGIPGSYDGIYRNVMRESSGNPMAINLWDINAQNGVPSKGLLQVIPPTFTTYHVAGTSWNIYDPVANITAACNYAADRYGSMDNVNSAY
jgi:hypothetical protein